MTTLWGALRTLRAAQAFDIRDHADHLAPGRWLPIRPRNKVWHHADANLPAPLFGTSGKASESAHLHSVRWNTGLQRAKRTAFSIALRLADARRPVTVPSLGDQQGKATIVIRVAGDRSADIADRELVPTRLIALSPGERAVRLGGAGSFDESYIDVRRRFEKHVPAPQFTVNEDGSVLDEQWCDGPLLSQLPGEQRLPHALALLDSYASLAAAEAVTDHGSEWRELPAYLNEVPFTERLKESLTDSQVKHLLSSAPLMPSQGDLQPKNVVIDNREQAPLVLDFDYCGWLPVWFDPVKLALTTVNASRLSVDESHAVMSKLSSVLIAAGFDDVKKIEVKRWAALVGVGDVWLKLRGTAQSRSANREGTAQPPTRRREFAQRAERSAEDHLSIACC